MLVGILRHRRKSDISVLSCLDVAIISIEDVKTGFYTKIKSPKEYFVTRKGDKCIELTSDQLEGLKEFTKQRKFAYSVEFSASEFKKLLAEFETALTLPENSI